MKRCTILKEVPITTSDKTSAPLRTVQRIVGQCNHAYDKAKRVGRCHFVCPKCKQDVTLELVLLAEAGIDVDKWANSLSNAKGNYQ